MSLTATTSNWTQGIIDQAAHTGLITLSGAWSSSGVSYDAIEGHFYWLAGSSNAYSTAGHIEGPQITSPASGILGSYGFYASSAELTAKNGVTNYSIGTTYSSYNIDTVLAADKTYNFVYEINGTNDGGVTTQTTQGASIVFKTGAIDPSLSTPVGSAITATTATISCNYFINTLESSGVVTLYYKKVADSSYTTGSSQAQTPRYTTNSISQNLTGLTPSTTYQVLLQIGRSTSNDLTSWSSTVGTFTTADITPTITTNTIGNLGVTTATLSGTVNPNGGATSYYFKWGTVNGGPYPNTTSAQGPSSSSSNINYTADISGLTSSTTYYYIAEASYGSTADGSQQTFTTNASAATARIMPSLYQFDRQYGVAVTPSSDTAINFFVEVPSATNSDKFLSSAVPWIAGDVLVDKNGAGFVNIGTLPTRIGATQLYTLTLTATEMQANNVTVLLTDVSGGPLWRDTAIVIQTKKLLGQINIDATAIGSNTPGFTVTGVGTSPGILSTGGTTSSGDITGVLTSHILRKNTATAGGASTITLDASASATDNYYQYAPIFIYSGTGSGQFRVVNSYAGATKIATVNRSWSTNPDNTSKFIIMSGEDVWNIAPGAELSAIPTFNSGFGNLVQGLFQRFFYKATQTASVGTLLKADSATSLGTRAVSDDGTTQSEGKIS